MVLTVESASSDTTEKRIKSFLDDHFSGVLGTSDMAANPHVAVIYYYSDQDFIVHFVTKRETQKYKNIEENRQVAFVIYDEKTQKSLQLFGYVKKDDSDLQRMQAVTNMANASLKLSGRLFPPAEKLMAGEYVAFRLVPQVLKLASYDRSESETNGMYETLLLSEYRDPIA